MMDQTKQLISEFNTSKVGQVLNGKEAFRNKMGCLLHGLAHKHPKMAMLGSSLLYAGGVATLGPLASAPAIFPAAYSVATATAKGRLREKASCEFLMNVAVRKTAAFSNFLEKKGIDAATREAAVQTYLKGQAPKFGYFKDYAKQFPDAARQIISAGTKGDLPLIHNKEVYHLEAVQEALTRGHNKGGVLHGLVQTFSPKTQAMEKKAGELAAQRWADRQAWEAQSAATREPWRRFSKAKEFERYTAAQTGKAVAQETTQQAVKTVGKEASGMHALLEGASHPQAARIEKVVQQAGVVAEKPVVKTVEKEAVKMAEKGVAQTAVKTAERLPLSPPLVKKISEKAAEKTGAKLATKGAAKTLAKKIPLLGLACGIGFGAMRAFDGDWTGAGMELSSGAASCFPGVGTAASVGIDAALIVRDIKGGR